MSIPIRVSDLPDSPEYGVCLRCPACGKTYSACRGDYFMSAPDTVMTCDCGAGDTAPILGLVRKRVEWIPITKEQVRS